MSRRMSCSMTVPAVRARTKTVTRRLVDSWTTLRPGDRLTLIEKGMGLPKGAQQVVLAEVEIVDVRVEPLVAILDEDRGTEKEGLGHLDPDEFVRFWLTGHGFGRYHPNVVRDVECRRIEWRYLDEVTDAV